MKKNIVSIALATLLALSFVSCGEKTPANDPAVAAGVMGAASSMCMTPSSPDASVTFSSTVDFSGSDYSKDIDSGSFNYQRQITFTNFQINYNGKTYTLNGTLDSAISYQLVASSVDPITGAVSTTFTISSYCYASGMTLVGPDYDGSFSVDCKQDIGYTLTSSAGSATASVTITTNGIIADKSYANFVISASFSY